MPEAASPSPAASAAWTSWCGTCSNKSAGVDLPTAVRMATLTPATIIGLQDEIGSLAAGKRADLLLLDGELNVTRVFLDGEAVTFHTS